MSYNLHPYSDCCPYRRNGKGLAHQTSEKTGEMPYSELKVYLRVALKAKRSKPRGRTLRLDPQRGPLTTSGGAVIDLSYGEAASKKG